MHEDVDDWWSGKKVRKGRWWPGMTKQGSSGRSCMVPGCETDVPAGDYVCAGHGKLKAGHERKFWQTVKDGKEGS